MMKLSIEEKAKAYDEAIKRAKAMIPVAANQEEIYNSVITIFPELKESEDERMVKFIKNQLFNIKKTITDNYKLDTELTKAIDWLEKQGEQKPIHEVKPKFTVGDKIKTKNGESFIITRFDRWGYWSEDLFICNFDDTDKWELVEQKPTEWSEEDREYMQSLLDIINGTSSLTPSEVECHKDWLKSLKDRVQPQFTWKPSDRQMNVLEYYMHTLACNEHKEILFGLYQDLKKLKE